MAFFDVDVPFLWSRLGGYRCEDLSACCTCRFGDQLSPVHCSLERLARLPTFLLGGFSVEMSLDNFLMKWVLMEWGEIARSVLGRC